MIANIVLRQHKTTIQNLITTTTEVAAKKAGNAAREAAEREHWGESCGPRSHDSMLEYNEKRLKELEAEKALMDDVLELMALTFCER